MEPTDIQKKIIEHEGNTVVLAAPGSGKTFVLSRKIRIAINNDDIRPYQGVIAISYTRKASQHLKTRTLEGGINEKNSFFGTIDNFCLNQIILPFAPFIFGYPAKELKIIKLSELPKVQQDKFKWFHEIHPDYNNINDSKFDEISQLYNSGYILIESLELLGVHLIKNCLACQRYLKARFKYIFIDEYQDADTYINDIFLSLVELGLTGTAVGDINQSIFGFAHKDSRYLTALSSKDNFTSFRLDNNFRCAIPIINYSNRLLDKNSHIIETNDDGVYLAHVKGKESDIAHLIDKYIIQLCKRLNIDKLCNIAILVTGRRTQEIIDLNLSTKHRVIETTALDLDINPRSQLYSQLLFYYFDKQIPLLKIIDDYIDYESLIERKKKLLKDLDKLIRSTNIAQIINLSTLFNQIADILLPKNPEYNSLTILNDILNHPDILKSYYPMMEDEIQIMTLHKSKGLEFDLVFHLNMNEWELPYQEPVNGNFSNLIYPRAKQDLNLHYVGITRAKKACILVSSSQRTNSKYEIKISKESIFLSCNGVDKLRKDLDNNFNI